MPQLLSRSMVLILLCLALPLYAIEIPKSLEEWKPWVLEKHPDINCPFLFNDEERNCSWPSELRIDAGDKGAQFALRVEVFKPEWVSLPGSAGFWPQEVSDNGNRIAVRDLDGSPQIYLTPSVHDIKGELRWSEMPRTLTIPEATGIVQLTLQGKTITAPALESSGELLLMANQKQNATAHQDSFEVRVFRKIEDQIPLRVTTLLQLDVSGKERELQLGQLLMKGFAPVEFSSQLPARIERDGSLRIQVKPGSWELTLTSQSIAPLRTLNYTASSELWPQQEIWVFSAERQLRSVQISGAQTIDPQQTQLPDTWKSLPAYLVTPETKFTLEELQRGESKDMANDLSLERSAWLSFDGEKIIFKDQITGTTHSSRLETLKPIELTAAFIDAQPQLITQLAEGKNAGVEIRSRNITLDAASQLPTAMTLPVSGWNEELNSVTTRLYMPPGWSMLTATGASYEAGSWFSFWSLWDLFTVLIIVIAIARVTTPAIGLLAAGTILIIYQRTGAPIFIWLNLIAAIALVKFVTGKFRTFVERYIYISFLLLTLAVLPFAVHQARIFVNPQLEHEGYSDWLPNIMWASSSKNKPAPASYPPAAAAPAAEPMADSVEEAIVAGAQAEREKMDYGALTDAKRAASLQRVAPVKIQKAYDPNQQTQTGVAVPTFTTNSVFLRWDGPVKADEATTLLLVSPWINRIGNLLAVILPLLLAGLLLQYTAALFGKKIDLPKIPLATGTAPAMLLAALIGLPTPQAQAQVHIDPSILKELEERLTQAPKCLPNCAAIESANLKVNQDELQLTFVVHSSDLIALPLPADAAQWWPNQVMVDDKTASLVQTDSHELLVSLPKGRHSIVIKANVQGRDALNLNFPVALHNVTSNTSGWEISGVPTEDQESQSLQLQRVERDANTAKAEHLRPDPIAPFVIVRRELRLDLEWAVTTRVTRVAPEFGAINLEVPLLPGESPLSTQVNANGNVAVHLEPSQLEFEWHSSLKQQSPIELKAPQQVPWVEIWSLNATSLWHTDAKGIAAVQMDKHQYQPLWQPWPGETLSLAVTKPKATKGSYVTIDQASINFQPGNRSSLSSLSFTIRTNQGGQYSFKLPEGAQLAKVTIDSAEQMISASDGQLKLPLRPGSQTINIEWKSDDGLGLITRSPSFQLEQGSSNQTIAIELPANRWPLFAGGPLVGPSILLWGMLVVVSLVAYGLGRSGLTPLKPYEWVLLGLGICTLDFTTFVLVAVWLIALSKRGKLQHIATSLRFKLLQLALFVFSLIALGSLIGTLPQGLLSGPDMHVLGNQSYGSNFRWYQDHSDLAFPQAWIISLPLWCYKLAMLVWSLWLASALIRWIRWGWQQLSHQALWYAPDEIVLKPKTKTQKSAEDEAKAPASEPATTTAPPPTGA
jgi:hypothetical protein